MSASVSGKAGSSILPEPWTLGSYISAKKRTSVGFFPVGWAAISKEFPKMWFRWIGPSFIYQVDWARVGLVRQVDMLYLSLRCRVAISVITRLTAGRHHETDSRTSSERQPRDLSYVICTSCCRGSLSEFYVVVATKEITVRGRGRERETVWNLSRSLNKQNNKCKLDNKNNKSLCNLQNHTLCCQQLFFHQIFFVLKLTEKKLVIWKYFSFVCFVVFPSRLSDCKREIWSRK